MKTNERQTLTPQEAAERYGLSVGTLANLRCNKQGPQFYKVGRKCLYRISEFETWLYSQPVKTIDSIE